MDNETTVDADTKAQESVPEDAQKPGNETKGTASRTKIAAISAIVALLVGAAAGAGVCYAVVGPKLSDAESKIATLNSDAEEYQTSIEDIQGDLESCQAMNGELNDARTKLNEINGQISDAQSRLDALNGQIDQVKGEPIQLPAGEFVVGTDVPAGRYIISGSSNFITHSSSGSVRINTILGDSAVGSGDYHGNLADGDIIDNSEPATLTPAE